MRIKTDAQDVRFLLVVLRDPHTREMQTFLINGACIREIGGRNRRAGIRVMG